MRVTVLGGGNGAMAVAGEWALAGHEVRIAELADYRGPMDGVAQAGAITLAGKLEGQAPIASCGVDFGEAPVAVDQFVKTQRADGLVHHPAGMPWQDDIFFQIEAGSFALVVADAVDGVF